VQDHAGVDVAHHGNCASICGELSTLAPRPSAPPACPSAWERFAPARPVHSGDHPLHRLRDGHGGAGVAGRNQPCAIPSRTSLEATRMELSRLLRSALPRCPASSPARKHARFRWTDPRGRPAGSLLPQEILTATRITFTPRLRRLGSHPRLRLRRGIAAHGVNGYRYHSQAFAALLFGYFDYFPSLVLAAVRHTRCGSFGSCSWGIRIGPSSAARRECGALARVCAECRLFGFGMMMS